MEIQDVFEILVPQRLQSLNFSIQGEGHESINLAVIKKIVCSF